MKILQTEKSIVAARHLVWHHAFHREIPFRVEGLQPEYAKIIEEEIMETLKRDVAESYQLDGVVSLPSPSPGHFSP